MSRRLPLVVVLALLAGCLPFSRAQNPVEPVSPPTPPRPKTIATPVAGNLIVPASRLLQFELDHGLHTRTSRAGQQAYFHTVEDVFSGSQVSIPRGSIVQADIVTVKRPGRLRGRAEIRLRFTRITLPDGTVLPLSASVVRAGFARASTSPSGDPQIKGEGGGTGAPGAVVQGGAQGALIGIWSGSAKGVGIGAAIGAAIGLGSVLLQRGPDLDLPQSTLFEARVEKPIEVPAAAAQRSAVLASRSSPPRLLQDSVELHDEPLPEARDVPRPVLRRRDPAPAPESPPPGIPAGAPAEEPPVPAARAPVPEGPSGDPAGTFTVSVDVPVVVVEAVVRDRAGRLMDNLKKEDFHLYEDGVEQSIRNFSRDELPLAIALVFDRSGSVAPYMPELREAAWQALSRLKSGDLVALFTFASDVERLEDLTTDRRRIADRIATITGGGGTNVVDAINGAVSYLGMVAPRRRRAVILISDNQGTVHPRASESQTIQLALETETVVYSVKTPGVGIPLTMQLPNLFNTTGSVAKMTRETGGEILESKDSGVGAALQTAIDRLRRRYTLGYSPSAPFRDSKFRAIRLRLHESFGKPPADYQVHTRRGYYPPTK